MTSSSGITGFGPVDADVSPALLALAQQQAVSVSSSVAGVTGAWGTGDYKISAQAADHADPGGGHWLLCDSSGIDASYTALVALVGSNRPDARGRTLVMQGTNASVSTLLANDGQAVANRRPHHRTTNALTATVSIPIASGAGVINTVANFGTVSNQSYNVAFAGSIGTNNANDALDTPSFLVPGNLFIHT